LRLPVQLEAIRFIAKERASPLLEPPRQRMPTGEGIHD